MGVQRKGLADTGFGFFDTSLVFQQITQAVVRLRKFGMDLQCAAHRDLRFFGAAQIIQHHVQIQVRDMKPLVLGDTAPKAGFGLRKAALALQGHAQIRQGRGILGSKVNGPAQAELGLHQPALVDQGQAERIEVVGIIGAEHGHLAQGADRFVLLVLRQQRQAQHPRPECVVRKTLRQHPRGLFEFGKTLLVQQRGERHDVRRSGRIRAARGRGARVAGVTQQAPDQFLDCRDGQARAPRVLQNLRRTPRLARKNQRIDITDPVLPMPGLCVAGGPEVVQCRAEIFSFERDHTEVVVRIGMLRLLAQNRAVGALRLRQLAKPVVVRALLHQAMQHALDQPLQIRRQTGRFFGGRLILHVPFGLAYLHSAEVNFARLGSIRG